MRTYVLLAILGVAAGDAPNDLVKEGYCALDGAEAVSDLMDSTMFIWASIARCGHSGEQVKCEVNVASSIQSLYSMVNVILKAVEKCGSLKTALPKCGIAASTFAEGLAGVTAASGGIAQKCPGGQQGNAGSNHWAHAAEAQCIVNLKSTAKAFFKVIKSLMRVKDNCKEGQKDYFQHEDHRACATNALQIVSAFAGMGEFLAGTVGQCSHANNKDIECSQQVSGLIHHLTKIAENGVLMSKECEPLHVLVFPIQVQVPKKVAGARLYQNGDKEHKDDTNDQAYVANLMLGAFLPVTAFVGFVGGKIFADRRTRQQGIREVMSDHE